MALIAKYLLSGIGLAGLSTTLMFYGGGNDLPALEEEVKERYVVGEEEQDELIEKAGLICGGKYCLPNSSDKRKFNVEKSKKDENVVFGYGTEGRLRVHRGTVGYPSGLRFTIEGSDIPLYSRKAWVANSISRLEEFENYEIKKEDGKYYLSRTKNSREGRILELGLPASCTLPEVGEITCSIFHIEKVKFEGGLVGEVDSETSLTISKTEDTSFKFTFTFPQDVTIGGKVVKAKTPADFRMKKHKDGRLTLVRAWENVNDLLDKVGLVCGEDGNCSIKSGGTLRIRKAEKQEIKEFSSLDGGRIKLYKNDDEYFNGLRLEVEGGNIGSGDNTLEEFENYEIKEKGDEYYLLLTKSSEKRIEELLKYPCSLSTSSPECNISNERKLQVIKFEGKEEKLITLQKGQTVKITVSKAPEADYPVGWKFTFTFPKDVTIGDKVVKANAPTDFKLKRHDDGKLTLERAWANDNDLAGKVGLSCETDGNCSLKTSGTLNIKKEGKDFQISDLSGGKIKLQKDTSGYSNGLKFEIKEGKIGSGDNVLEEFETYEIKEEGDKYYLVLKTKAEERIKKLLNFPSECFVSSECSISSEDKFKAINFENKNEKLMTLGNKTVKISVSNAPDGDFPFSRKFTVTSPGKITISSDTVVNANAPTDFKLKKHNDGNLFLERVWTNENELIGKVGLNCDVSDNCTIKNGSLNIRKNGKDLQISEISGGKIKLYKNSDNYSNGLKFKIEDGNIVSGNNTLEEFETYEIKEDRSKYYLDLKTSADEKIKELLKYPKRCSLSSPCDKLNGEDIKKINFSGKEGSSLSLPQGQTVKITVSKTSVSDFPLGRKFTVESTGDLKISNSNSVKAKTPTEFKIKKNGSGQKANLSLEKAWTLETLTEKVGLNCSDESNCTITSQNLNVKKDGKLLKGLSRSETQSSGKIKLIKDKEGYNEGFKFQILDANIKLSGSGGQTIVLEEFESYEIKNEGDIYYLNRKTNARQEKWEALGLPAKCLSYKENVGCQIFDTELGKIKFYGKNESKSVTIPSGARVWLKTFNVSDPKFPLGIKVKMEVKDKRVNIPKGTNDSIVLWKDYETEFRIKDEKNGNYSLESTFDMNALVKKIGIENGNCSDGLGCTIGSKVNVRKNGTNYRRNASVAETTKKITYRLGAVGGFANKIRFTVPKGGIRLNSGSGNATWSIGNLNSIEEGTYEILELNIGTSGGEGKISYLSHKFGFTEDGD